MKDDWFIVSVVFLSGVSAVSEISKETEMKERTTMMRTVCSQYPIRRQVKTRLSGRLFYISEKHSLSYCRVAKVGSTFWTQVFMTLGNISPVAKKDMQKETMFDKPRDEVHQEMKKHSNLTMPFSDSRVHTTTSFLVTRNPYSRLFSSYIDQIFLPNKWLQAAKMVKSAERRECGSDVTFEEFLNYISSGILKGGSCDLHWAPIFSICLPCNTDINFVAKQETFNEDAEYILNYVGVEQPVKDEVKRAVGQNLIENSLGTLVHTYVSKGHSTKKGCITEKDLAKKLWTAFQIQGYIYNGIQFPEHKFQDVSQANIKGILLNAVLDAVHKRKLSSAEREKQRHAWKVHYWQQVSKTTLDLVQDAYYEDFHVFGYNIDPSQM